MSEARRLTLAELRETVSDPDELAKGARLYDEGVFSHLARFQSKLFADTPGVSGSTNKVQIRFEGKAVRARCSCFAARSRPFCKHAAGLLVAWARAPESFAEASASPTPEEPRRRSVKKGKVDPKDLMRRGVEQAATLVRELAVSGVATIAPDRADQVRALSDGLRDARLRRLAGRTQRLARHLELAAAQSDAFDASDYAELVGDMLLTVRKLEKHLEGEPLAPEHVEQLIGKTWTKKDRAPIEGLDLVEYSFESRITADEFVIRESRFFDLSRGDHYSEKQILPGFLVARTTPKKSHARRVLRGAKGTMFPSYPPRRLDLESVEHSEPLDSATLAALVDRSHPSATSVLVALQQRRTDIFAPEAMPVSMRVDAIYAEGARLRVVDPSGAALFLPDDPTAEETLARILRGTEIVALLGDVALDGALPTLFPLAAVTGQRHALELSVLGGLDVATLLLSRKMRLDALQDETPPASRWVDVARQAGASASSIALGEVREELAGALATGLVSVVPRSMDPLVSRLADLGLTKPAELLAETSRRADPAGKLDAFVKLHQVLGLALSRLVGAAELDRGRMQKVPTYESVYVRRIEVPRGPAEVASLRGAGKMNRYEAAVHYEHHFASLPEHALVDDIFLTWADGSASPFIARTVAKNPATALAASRRALSLGATARVAKLTALRALSVVGTAEARELLESVSRQRTEDPALASLAARAVARLDGIPVIARPSEEVSRAVLHAPAKEARIAALEALASGAHLEALPLIRASFAGDIAADVRHAAALALANLLDTEVVDTLLRMVRDRGREPDAARSAVRALGILGDARATDDLVRLFVSGWHPAIAADALRGLAPSALLPIVTELEKAPELAERKSVAAIIGVCPPQLVERELERRLELAAGSERFPLRARLYLTIASSHASAARRIASRIRALAPATFDKGASREERSLARACDKALAD